MSEVRRRRGGIESCKSKIRELELAAVVEEEVGGFEVPVEDPVGVEVGDGGKELEEEGFHFRLEEGLVHVCEEGLEVVLDEVHDYVDSASRVA